MPTNNNFDLNDPVFQRKLKKTIKKLEQLSDKDLPEAIAKYWKKIASNASNSFAAKNARIWGVIWNSGINKSYEDGIKKTSYSTFVSSPGVIREAADDYFEGHGLDLVKTLTESDLLKLKGQMIANWGKGEDAFAKEYKDSYSVSPDRIKTIYRTEHHRAMNHGVLAVSKKLGREYKQWIVPNDERTCPICKSHIDDIAPIDIPFKGVDDEGNMLEYEIPNDSHPNCFSEDTEVFTEGGWKLFEDVTNNEKVWTLTCNGKTHLDTIKKQISYKISGYLLSISGSEIDFMITPEHEMVVIDFDDYSFKKVRADSVSITSKIPNDFDNPYLYVNPNKIEIVPYDGIVYCLEMNKNPILFVRRNGKEAWSGNCRCTMITVREKDLTEEQKASLIEKGYLESIHEQEDTDGELWTPKSDEMTSSEEYVPLAEDDEYGEVQNEKGFQKVKIPDKKYLKHNESPDIKLNYKCKVGTVDDSNDCQEFEVDWKIRPKQNRRGKCPKDSYKEGTFECDPSMSDAQEVITEEKPNSILIDVSDKSNKRDKNSESISEKNALNPVIDIIEINNIVDDVMKSINDVDNEGEAYFILGSYMNARSNDGSKLKSDVFLERIVSKDNFDGLPKLVSLDELDNIAGKKLYRGVSSSEYANEFKRGKYFGGTGILGSGIYTAYGKDAKNISTIFAARGEVIEMKLDESAKVIDYEDIGNISRNMQKAISGKMYSKDVSDRDKKAYSRSYYIIQNEGRLAALLGYDAINVPHDEYMIILNRSKIVVGDNENEN